MDHVIEAASSGRAKCRGCGQRIVKDELRLGERLPNPFAEGLMTHWFHLSCAAYKRPDVLLEALPATDADVANAVRLEAAAKLGLEHRRLPRIDGAQRSPTGRARCRCCREMIDKGSWRIALVFYQEGRFEAGGYIHAGCSREHFGTEDVLDRAAHFAPELGDEELSSLQEALRPPTSAPP